MVLVIAFHIQMMLGLLHIFKQFVYSSFFWGLFFFLCLCFVGEAVFVVVLGLVDEVERGTSCSSLVFSVSSLSELSSDESVDSSRSSLTVVRLVR